MLQCICNIYTLVQYIADNPRQIYDFCSFKVKPLLGHVWKKLIFSWLSYPWPSAGEGGLHHVTVSHHLCETGKNRVCKARVDFRNW